MGWKSLTSCCIGILIGNAAVAVAHPMGENSVNQYLLIRVRDDGVHLGYRIDFAENPAVREMKVLDADGDGTVSAEEKKKYLADRAGEWASRVSVKVGGKERDITPGQTDLKVDEGVGGRKTVLVMLDLVTTGDAAGKVEVTVGNYSAVPGWREAAVIAGEGWWVVDGEKRLKARVLDQRGEAAEVARDWVVGFACERTGSPRTVRGPTKRPSGG